MHENKQLICNFLTLALQETRGAHDLITLNYDTEKEVVIGTFAGGGKKSMQRCSRFRMRHDPGYHESVRGVGHA